MHILWTKFITLSSALITSVQYKFTDNIIILKMIVKIIAVLTFDIYRFKDFMNSRNRYLLNMYIKNIIMYAESV